MKSLPDVVMNGDPEQHYPGMDMPFFGGGGDRMQGRDWGLNSRLRTGEQALYCLSYPSGPFCSGYFGNGVL
jgi:hypothetical protein